MKLLHLKRVALFLGLLLLGVWFSLSMAHAQGSQIGSCSSGSFVSEINLNAPPSCRTMSASGQALTKTDDTNVTLTLGGSPTTALLQAASLTLGWAGQLGLTRGGTAASLTASNGGIIYSTASAMAVLAGTATAGQVLLSGKSTTPAWSTATYPATVTSGRVLLATGANVVGDGPAPIADGTRTVECTTPGNVASFTTTNGLITAVATC